MIAADTRLTNEPLHQVSAETGRVIERKSNILIEMEHFDAIPIDAGSSSEKLQEVELRGAGGGDDAGGIGLCKDALKRLRSMLRGGRSRFGFTGQYVYLHVWSPSNGYGLKFNFLPTETCPWPRCVVSYKRQGNTIVLFP